MKRIFANASRIAFVSSKILFKLGLIFLSLFSNIVKVKLGTLAIHLKELEDLMGTYLSKNSKLYKNKAISYHTASLLTYNKYMNDASNANINSQSLLAQELFTSASLTKEEVLTQIGIANQEIALIGSDVSGSIGHTAITLALRVKINVLFPEIQKKFIVVYSNSANQRYLDLWKKYFPMIRVDQGIDKVIERQLWPLYDEISWLRLAEKTYKLHDAHDKFSRVYDESYTEPLLNLEDYDKEIGYKFLKEKGFDNENGWFVTLHVRNSPAFLRGKNLQDTYGRNARIQTYQKAVDHIIATGGFVIRIGTPDGCKLIEKSGYIDYSEATNQNDVLNTFFLAECRFLIGTNSGPICVPPTFGRPVLTTNAPGIGVNAYFSNSILLPKLVIDKNGSILSLSEMLDGNSGWTDAWINNENVRKLYWKDNSEEEIYEATLEMLTGIDSNLSPLQSKFENSLRTHGSTATSLVSNSFLLRWADTLL
jgi:putative glycosyltransferase (TIGR04372 family)